MSQYKIYRKDNYILVVNNLTQETQYGFVKEVFVDKSNLNIANYRIFNVRDFDEKIIISISQILKEDGTPYTQIEFEDFYKQNTGNFNSGGISQGVQTVTGSSVDNTDPQNPIINAIEEAPIDGNQYGRQDGQWSEIDTSNKLDRGGYNGDAGDLKAEIDAILVPDQLISAIPPTRSVNTFTYPALGYEVLIDKTLRQNPVQFVTTISAASTTNHKRVDLIYFKPDNTLAKIIGTEDLIVAPRPDVPNGSVGVSFINVFGNIIQDPTPITREISIQDSFGNERFTVAPEGYIRFRGANFNSAAKEVQIDPLVGGVIFISSSGDDTTGEAENRNKAYLTLNKAIDVFFANPNILYIEIISTGTFTTNRVFNNGTTRTFELRSNFPNVITINTNGLYCFTTQQFKINAPNSTINLSPTTTTSFGSNTHRCFVDINCNVLSNNSFFGADNLGNFTLKCNNLNLTGIGGLHAAKTDPNTIGSIEVGTITFTGNSNLFSQNNTSSGAYNLNFKQINHNGTFNLTLPSTAIYSIDHGSITPTGTIAWAAYLSGAAQISIRYKTGAMITSNIGINRFNALYLLELTGICSYSNSDQLLFRDNSSKTTIINAQITCKNFSHNVADNGVGIRIISSTINVTSTLGTFDTFQGFVHTSPIYYFEGTCYVLGLSPLTTGFNLYVQNVANTASKPIMNITKGVFNTNGKFDRNRISITEAPLNQYFDTVQRQLVIVNEKEEIINQVLDSTKTYKIDGVITLLTGEYIDVPASGLTIEGYGYDTSGIIKNISGQSIFRSPAGNSGNLTLSSVYFNPGLGTVWNLIDSTGSHAIELNDVNFNGGTLGVLNGYRQGTATTCGFYNLTDGLIFEGSWSGFKITNSNVIGFSATGTFFKKGSTTVFSSRFYADMNIQLVSGAKICDFQDSNIINKNSFQIVNCYVKIGNDVADNNTLPHVSTVTSALFPNISVYSNKSYFFGNNGIKNTHETINDSMVFTLNGVQNVFDIIHVLGVVPRSFQLTFSDGANTDFIQSSRIPDASKIRITCDNVPAAGTITVYYSVST